MKRCVCCYRWQPAYRCDAAGVSPDLGLDRDEGDGEDGEEEGKQDHADQDHLENRNGRIVREGLLTCSSAVQL